ncbi:uncharacterized protein LOC118159526 isoform X2 [Oxyura jamaicensis]|uniref:uncharacterized protein LOC118159526 isoform X2 n=1 Tax=Oxyura jamaicensis TaxID=8884 RepID=UPI0015A58649|nr:uncharacterized protein LOC118159526 isoform X2 [Oxyura jamaicensis]
MILGCGSWLPFISAALPLPAPVSPGLKSDRWREQHGATRQRIPLPGSPAQSPQHPLDHSDMIAPRLVMFLTTVHLLPCQKVSGEAAVPAPTLRVLQGQKEYFFGDAVTLVCTTPPNITGKLTYQIFGEAGWAISGFSSTHEFILSRMQHRGPHFCSYSLKQGQKWLTSPASEKLVIKIGGNSCFPLLRLLVVGSCFLTINSLIFLFFWARGRTKDASFLYGASPAGISQLDARSPNSLQEDNRYEEH